MSFLYKRLAKLGEISAKKDTKQKYDFSKLTLEILSYIRTIPTKQLETKNKYTEIKNKYK